MRAGACGAGLGGQRRSTIANLAFCQGPATGLASCLQVAAFGAFKYAMCWIRRQARDDGRKSHAAAASTRAVEWSLKRFLERHLRTTETNYPAAQVEGALSRF